MAARKYTIVCRDCGEVVHVDLAAMKPGSPIACAGCGLLASPQSLRAPSLGLRGPGAAQAEPARAPPRRTPGARPR